MCAHISTACIDTHVHTRILTHALHTMNHPVTHPRIEMVTTQRRDSMRISSLRARHGSSSLTKATSSRLTPTWHRHEQRPKHRIQRTRYFLLITLSNTHTHTGVLTLTHHNMHELLLLLRCHDKTVTRANIPKHDEASKRLTFSCEPYHMIR